MKIIGICILPIIIIGGFFLLFLNGFFTSFIEKVINEKPEVKVVEYLKAVKKNDEAEALTIWELPEWEGWKLSKESSFLQKRRENLTKNLIKNGVENFDILKIEWWGTCCEPGVINNPREAGGARIRVQLVNGSNSKYIYIFDVFHRETSYWGAAQGYPIRHWVLRDVYFPSQEPLFWKFSTQK